MTTSLESNSAYDGRKRPGLVNEAFSSYNALRVRSDVLQISWDCEYGNFSPSVTRVAPSGCSFTYVNNLPVSLNWSHGTRC